MHIDEKENILQIQHKSNCSHYRDGQKKKSFSPQKVNQKYLSYDQDLIQQNLELRNEIEKSEFRKQIQFLKQQNDGLNVENVSLKERLQNISSDVKESDDKSQKLIGDLRQEVWDLKNQLQLLNMKQCEQVYQNDYIKKQMSSLQLELESEQVRKMKVDEAYQNIKSQCDNQQMSLLDSDGRVKRLLLQVEQIQEDYEESKRQVQKQQNDIRLLMNQVFEAENQKIHLISEVSQLRNYKIEQDAQILKKSEIYDNETNELINQRDQLMKSSDILKAERDQWRQDCDILKLRLIEMDELRNRLKYKESEIDNLQIDNDKLKWKIRKDPNGILSDLKAVQLEVQTEKAHVIPVQQDTQKQDDMQNELNRLGYENKQLQQEIIKLDAENNRLRNEVEQMNIYIGDLRLMFDRERLYLEDRVQQLQKATLYSNYHPSQLSNQSEQIRMPKDFRYDQSEGHQVQKKVTFQESLSPYSVPQLNSLGKSK